MSARTAVYRLFDADDALLYVGITGDVGRRWDQHLKDKPWWPQVNRQTVEWHSDRATAEATETVAIRTERPAHNVRHSVLPQPERPAPDPAEVPTTEARANLSEIIKVVKLLRRTCFLTSRHKRQIAVVPAELGDLIERVGGVDAAADIIAASLPPESAIA